MLEVTSGLTHFQVLQRDGDSKASVSLEGTCDAAVGGVIEARVLFRAFAVKDWDWRPAGEASGGTWRVKLEGIPAGGPYVIELRRAGNLSETTRIKDVLVGDIWVLAGQSNMEGMGILADAAALEKPNPLVHSFDMADQWRQAEEPLHWLCDSIDPVHCDQTEPAKTRLSQEIHRTRTQGAGLGLAFASEMVKRTGTPIGLIPCAHGGTSMSQWDPALRDRGGRSLYGSMIRRFKQAGGRVRGNLWYQGETDAHDGAVKEYAARLDRFIASVRRDFGDPDLPFLMVQIGRWIAPPAKEYPPKWNAIQEIQRGFSGRPNVQVISSVDLELDDGIHIGTQGLSRLGRRLAGLAGPLIFDNSSHKCVELAGVEVEPGRIRVKFANVTGRLLNEPRISGFSIRTKRGEKLDLIFDVTVDETRPSDVLIHLIERPPRGSHLWYGFGHDPYCNLTDQRDISIPVFGPIPLT
jgi:sialate O-acetylesterase